MELIIKLFPLLIPLILIQIGLIIYGLNVLKHTKHVRGDSKIMWGVIIVIVNIFGPILFLVWGRLENDTSSEDN